MASNHLTPKYEIDPGLVELVEVRNKRSGVSNFTTLNMSNASLGDSICGLQAGTLDVKHQAFTETSDPKTNHEAEKTEQSVIANSAPDGEMPEHYSSRGSLTSSEGMGEFCRICHDGASKENLLSPCHCAGSMGLIHKSCIEKWLGAANLDRCEVCGQEYTTERVPRPFIDWLRNPTHSSDKRNLYGDAICFFILTPLALISTWLCLNGAVHYSQYDENGWETAGLCILSGLLLVVYLIWCAVATRYHVHVFISWRKVNQVVKLLPKGKKQADLVVTKRCSVDFLVSMMRGRSKGLEKRGSSSSTCVPVLYPENTQSVIYSSASDTVVWIPTIRDKISTTMSVNVI